MKLCLQRNKLKGKVYTRYLFYIPSSIINQVQWNKGDIIDFDIIDKNTIIIKKKNVVPNQ